MESIELSGCLVLRDEKILLLYRKDKEHWEVPGGKVQENESPTEAAVRETEEEIGVDVDLKRPVYTGEFQKDGEIYEWNAYMGRIKEEPEIQEEKFGKLKWFNGEELDELELAPNLEMVLPALRRI
jgi:8-oxo-dGTP diphosphatase